MFKQFLAATAAVTLAVPAMAGGIAPPAPEPTVIVPVAPVAQRSFDWSGFYVGLQAGNADFDAEYSTSGGLYDNFEGGYYGLHAGYMQDFGRFVVGGELRYDDGSNVTGPFGFSGDTMISARLRLGYDMGRVLPFVAVGGGQLSIVDGGGNDYSDTGILYGVGVDYAVTDRWIVGAEITHHEFDDFDTLGVDISGNTIGVKASFRF